LEKLDETDRKIVSLLVENPETSQSAIARHLKLSQPAICARMKRLKNSEIITHLVGVNLKSSNFYIVNNLVSPFKKETFN